MIIRMRLKYRLRRLNLYMSLRAMEQAINELRECNGT